MGTNGTSDLVTDGALQCSREYFPHLICDVAVCMCLSVYNKYQQYDGRMYEKNVVFKVL